ncbi:MAG: isoleucine--tRNA ligase [Bdellovibrionia bacterium]
MAQAKNSVKPYEPVKPDVDLPAKERELLEFWRTEKIFEASLEQTKSKKYFSFYDGPPFATGLPHYGHLLAGTLKDIVPRYWTMQGYHVPRRFGWDCHGLPVEYEIDKTLGINNRKQVFAMGVDKYNETCRGIVTRYTKEWRKTVERVGRWVDMDNAYYTMQPEFMQSVWWVVKQLWDKGLVYEGYKVVPYSVGCSTSLSNFEANQNYKEVQDPALTVLFIVDGKKDHYLTAWTTTPWTLPSNLGLAVGLDIDYAAVKEKSTGRIIYVAKALVENTFPKGDEHEIVAEMKGSALMGWTYEPLFPYFASEKKNGAFKVIDSDHVTTESGTGIVHMAPAFGEEDFFACKKHGIPLVNPVDDDGMFTKEVPDYAGIRVKEADKDIIARLKKENKVLKHDTIMHSYPFCWRSDTPLIYRAVSNWFVKVEQFKGDLIKANSETHWTPEHLRDGRFGNWLENARDWAISRNRFWGTPLPIWKNDSGEVICVGSVDELHKLSGVKLPDLHLEHVMKVTIPSQKGKEPLKHIGSVLDCWFESGSMPYAQVGYPLKNKEQFEGTFPADFIAEGLDQTRGWFYTLMVLSSALFKKPAFKNVVVNGLVLAEDGRKMSKSLKNYPDPMEVIEKYGADALRLYLIDSPVVKAQEVRFSEKGVNDIVRRIMLRWWNSYSFFVNYANVDGFVPKGDAKTSPNILDQWILSRLNSLTDYTTQEMSAYRLYNVVPGLLSFVEELTNTYIRFNRRHFWQDGMPEDKRLAYETLYEVLMTLSRLMAPFAPFMSEMVYKNLSSVQKNSLKSVHLAPYPTADKKLENPELEEAVRRMEVLVMMGRNLREKFGVKGKIPLKTLRLIHRDPLVLGALKKLEPYVVEELNVREVIYDSNEEKYIRLTAKANFPALGKRLGPKMKSVAALIAKIQPKEILELEKGSSLQMDGESITNAEIEIRRVPVDGHQHLSSDQLITIEMDPEVSTEQVLEGLSREVIRRVQMARKNADLNLDDRINLQIKCSGEIRQAVETHGDRIKSETLALSLSLSESPTGNHVENSDIDGEPLGVGFSKIQK